MARAHWMTDELELFQQSCRRLFEAEISPNASRWTEAGVVDREFWRSAGRLGLLGASIPEAYGGSGGDRRNDAVTLLEVARTGFGGWGFLIQSCAEHYVLAYGSEQQKRSWLPPLCSGEWVASIAMTEPGTGSDLQSIRTVADTDGDDYVINGSKTFIGNGHTSDFVILAVKSDRTAGARGISLIGVETAQAPGFRRGRRLHKLGLGGQDTSELFFENMRVPRNHLIGTAEGQGFGQLMEQFPWERLSIAIHAMGVSETALRHTLDYVQQRKVFGQRLMDLQNTRFKLAEAKTKLEVTRAFVDECIERCSEGSLAAASAAMAKWWATQVQCEICDECLQLHGGYGYMMEYPIAQMYADARAQKIYGGTNEIQKEIIARALDSRR